MLKFSNIKPILPIITLACLVPGITLAQKNNLNNLILAVGSNQSSGMVTGNTGGAYSLASITNRDSYGNPCMGYGDPEPDHVLTLKSDFARLTMQVDSGGNDTTLVVQSLEFGNIRCAFGQNSNRDAVIQDGNWSAGTYYIWVGSMSANQRSPYRLSVQQ